MKSKSRNMDKDSERHAFIAQHRGGPLSMENHRRLMRWACTCAAHVISLVSTIPDATLTDILHIAEEWAKGHVSTGAAMKASLKAHAVARQTDNLVHKAIARAVGQAVATAHMADHALGAAFYALRALKVAGMDVEAEKQWQSQCLTELPAEIVDIVTAMWTKKELNRRI